MREIFRGPDMLPVLRAQHVGLRPLLEGEVDLLMVMLARPSIREWWGSLDDAAHVREGLVNDGAAFAIEVDGTLAGWLGFNEETEPDHRCASLDIFLAPECQDRRLGSAALRLAARWLFAERGHHRLTIDPACSNLRAIRAYSAVGFRPVGTMRRYERGADGSWHDNLLMDLLRDELATEEALLDNPAYEALCSAHARLALVRGRARRYPVDVAPFLALPSPPSAQDWRDAAELVAPGSYVAGQYGARQPPDGWRAVQTFDLVQMVEQRVIGLDCAEAIELGAADVPEMLELVAQTEPGPFLARTIELGDYLGIRRHGALVAMAGERFRLDGWTEISAVCTRPDHRGQGLASALMGALIASIQRRSERVFLHVLSTNIGAIRLYEELGFRVRRTATLTVVVRESVPDARA